MHVPEKQGNVFAKKTLIHAPVGNAETIFMVLALHKVAILVIVTNMARYPYNVWKVVSVCVKAAHKARSAANAKPIIIISHKTDAGVYIVI